MKISRFDPVKRTTVEMEIDVTEDQIFQWQNGMLIQEAMPNIPKGEREFIKTGITPESWKELFGPFDETPA
tara:strand:- start:8175 stop:8387 length:213 start_codon:yes stop_codon:yes gene_type:complete